MVDVGMTILVVVLLAIITAVVSSTYPRGMQRWPLLALLEYLLCAAAQLVYSRVIVHGGDTILYANTGASLARALDANFSFAAPELLALFFHQPSFFDPFVYGGGGINTSSMHAAAGFLAFAFQGSEYAVSVFVAGLSLFGALAIFRACRDAAPDAPADRLFAATVLFPSVAFWTATLHKESFCLMGIGATLSAWRAIYQRRFFRVLLLAPLGLVLTYLFRAPVLAPLLIGIVVFFVLERLQKTRGVEGVIVGPIYFGLALLVLSVGMVALTRLDPALSISRLGETVSTRQQAWSTGRGGSAIDVEDGAPTSLAGQLVRLPLALVNALFRPQFFDVNNFGALLSAIEMTAIVWMIFQALRGQGLGRVLGRIQRSPFLLMCLVITVVGCTFVGLVTPNFGSLARYRVPFLPFYGCLVLGIGAPAVARTAAKVPATLRARGRRLVPRSPGRRNPIAAPSRST